MSWTGRSHKRGRVDESSWWIDRLLASDGTIERVTYIEGRAGSLCSLCLDLGFGFGGGTGGTGALLRAVCCRAVVLSVAERGNDARLAAGSDGALGRGELSRYIDQRATRQPRAYL